MIGPPLDPAALLVLRLALALLLAVAALHKLRGPQRFREVLAGYALLPPRAVAPAARGVPLVEAGLAAALLVPAAAPAGALGAAALLLLYAAALGVNLARGRRDLDCGCLGVASPAGRPRLHAGLVARNLLLTAGALAAAAPSGGRPLAPLDAVTIPAGVAFLALAGAAASGLLARGPRLRAEAGR